MKLQPECFGCLVSQAGNLLQSKELPPSRKVEILKEVTTIISRLDPASPPPVYGREIHLAIQKLLDEKDPYFPQKKMSNDNALELYPLLKKEVEEAPDSLGRAVQAAIAGNIIDYGAPGSGTMESIKESLSQSLSIDLQAETLERFREDTGGAERILYIGDNAGELVFDRLLLEQLGFDRTVFALRGAIILNDATLSDAEYTGLFDEVKLIDTGDSTPGVFPERSSEAFLKELAAADVVILKGQGNFETLYERDLTDWRDTKTSFYYLFKVKCQPVSDMTNLPLGSIAFLKTRQ